LYGNNDNYYRLYLLTLAETFGEADDAPFTIYYDMYNIYLQIPLFTLVR